MIGADAVVRSWRANGLPSALSASDALHLALALRLLPDFKAAPELSPTPELLTDKPDEPSFAGFRPADAPALVAGIHQPGALSERSRRWCERLMRYCEVFRFDLENRAADKWGGEAAARSGLLAVAALLAEATLATRDYRYLNTALKLLDRPRVLDSRLLHGSEQKPDHLLAAHAAIAAQAALDRLKERPDG